MAVKMTRNYRCLVGCQAPAPKLPACIVTITQRTTPRPAFVVVRQIEIIVPFSSPLKDFFLMFFCLNNFFSHKKLSPSLRSGSGATHLIPWGLLPRAAPRQCAFLVCNVFICFYFCFPYRTSAESLKRIAVLAELFFMKLFRSPLNMGGSVHSHLQVFLDTKENADQKHQIIVGVNLLLE